MAHAPGPSRPNLTPIPNTNPNPNPNPSPSRPNPTTAQHRIESSKYTPAPTCPVLPVLSSPVLSPPSKSAEQVVHVLQNIPLPYVCTCSPPIPSSLTAGSCSHRSRSDTPQGTACPPWAPQTRDTGPRLHLPRPLPQPSRYPSGTGPPPRGGASPTRCGGGGGGGGWRRRRGWHLSAMETTFSRVGTYVC